MNCHHIFPASVMLLAAATAMADDLNTQITVEHEIVPEEHVATRLRLFPSVSLPAINPGRLPAASSPQYSLLTPFITPLEPAPFAAALTKSPWRGYAVLGYGPLYNLGASAGYRFVDTEKVTANAYMQFNGVKYTSKHPDADYRGYGKVGLKNNSVTAGANTSWRALNNAFFTADVLYGFSAYNFPLPELNAGIPYKNPEDCFVDHTDINMNQLQVNAGWNHTPHSKFNYAVNATYGIVKYGRLPNAMTENRGKLHVNLNYDFGHISHWNLLLATEQANSTANGINGNYTKGFTSVNPSYLLTLKHFSAKIGVKVDFENGNDSQISETGFIYPQLLLRWSPSDFFTLYGRSDGYTDLNSLASLYQAQPYMFSALNHTDEPFGLSKIYNFELGFTVGPFRGASLRIFAGADIAKDWLTPTVKAGEWANRDVKGCHLGAEANYSFRSYLDLSAKFVYATAPDDDFDTGYYLWRDHARTDLQVKATVRPIQPLSISLAYHMRTNRAKPTFSRATEEEASQNLGNIHDLNTTIDYNINDRWSVFINGENLVNHLYYLGPAIPCQGIRAMVGATYKF